jgi:hypothetical protein
LSAGDKAITALRSEMNAVQREEGADFPSSHATDAAAAGQRNVMSRLVARHTKLIEQFRALVAQYPAIRRIAEPAISINVELRNDVAVRTETLGKPGWQIAADCALERGRKFLVDDLTSRASIASSAKSLGVTGVSGNEPTDALSVALLDLYRGCQSAIGAVAGQRDPTPAKIDLETRAYRRLLRATQLNRATSGPTAPAWSAFLRFTTLGVRIFSIVDRFGLHPPAAELSVARRLSPMYAAAGRASDAAAGRLDGTR